MTRPIALGRGPSDPPVELSAEARDEYTRLLGVLREFGSIEVVDLIVVANAARTKALLDKAYADLGDSMDRLKLLTVTRLTTQHRALMRELGLTTCPNRASFRPRPIGSERDEKPSPWQRKLKVGG